MPVTETLLCMRKHAEPVDGCESCHMRATSDKYRTALAKNQGKAPPTEKVGEPPRPKRKARPMPGTVLADLLKEIGVAPEANCYTCGGWVSWMNGLGVAGCRRDRVQIVARLKNEAKENATAWRKLVAGRRLLLMGIRPTVGGIFDEAMRQCEQVAAADMEPAARTR